MRRLASIVAGRRAKWLVLLAWVVLLVIFAPLGAKLADVTTDQTEDFLPSGAESTEVLRTLRTEFPGGQTQGGLIVYQRDGGLTEDDRAKIATDAATAARRLPLVGQPVVPFLPRSPPDLVSRDGSVAYTAVALPDDRDRTADWGKELRSIAHENERGMNVYVTGNLGFGTDAAEVFGSVDTTVLLVTVLLVLVLLGAIYRSPVIAIIPLIVVGVAYGVAQGLIYLYADSGEVVSTNATSILVVLMFGVGTDYCLLLVARYREELRAVEDKHEAMRRAIGRVGPAILASGLTVVCTMLVLLVAETGSIHTLGPVAAIGVAVVMLAGVTLLPTMLAITGRAGFWPRRRLVAHAPGDDVEQRSGLWRRLGERVLRRPAAALSVTVGFFLVASLGLFAYEEDYSTTTFFKDPTESVDGFRVLESAFPAGTLAPSTALVEREDGPVRPADVALAVRRLEAVPDVAAAVPSPQRSRDGSVVQVSVILDSDPYKSAALGVVPRMRDAVADVAPGVRVLVGGGSALQYDFDESSKRDLVLIVPIALLVIAIILGILLEAILAPLVLIATVVLSFFGTVGLSLLIIRFVVGDAGVDNSLPTFAFIFLVALGIDYTIFLMSRVREEARRHGTREGTLRALAATGPVITSAGIILAGTFSVLMTLPVTFTFDLGLLVALGILLDTFVVRTIMVPAALELIGDRIWWPSSAQGGGHVFHEPGDGAGEGQREPEPEPAASA